MKHKYDFGDEVIADLGRDSDRLEITDDEDLGGGEEGVD